MASAVRRGGWIYYSEVCEGYGPRDVHGAIQRRDAFEVEARLRQIINGFAERPGFRFFVADTLPPLLDESGVRVENSAVDQWNDLPCLQSYWCRTADTGPRDEALEACGDYAERDSDFLAIRALFRRTARARRSRTTLSERERRELMEFAGQGPGRWAPFALYLLMADSFPSSWAARRPVRSRIDGRLRTGRDTSVDWERVGHLSNEFVRHWTDRRRAERAGAGRAEAQG